MNRIEGRTVVITGAASGIGKAIAEGFLADGARVVGGDVEREGLEALGERGALVKETDVRSADAVAALVELATNETGRVDALFNNAGFGSRARAHDIAEGEFERMIEVHLYGALYGLRAAIPVMQEQGSGCIINTLSRAAEVCGPGDSAYSAAKAALWALTRAAAAENAESGIRVNGLIPGPTNTGIWGRDMPQLQPPEVVYPTARLLATLPPDGPTGEVFWNEKPYPLMDPRNPVPGRRRREK